MMPRLKTLKLTHMRYEGDVPLPSYDFKFLTRQRRGSSDRYLEYSKPVSRAPPPQFDCRNSLESTDASPDPLLLPLLNMNPCLDNFIPPLTFTTLRSLYLIGVKESDLLEYLRLAETSFPNVHYPLFNQVRKPSS